MTAHSTFYTWGNDNVSKKEERRGLVSIDNCVDATIQEFEEYTEKSLESNYSNQ